MANLHAEISPSGLKKYKLCPGAFKMEKDIPEVKSDLADEGTKCHEAIELNKYDHLMDEQLRAVNKCIKFAEKIAPRKDWNCEKKTTILDGFNTITYGTVDLIIEFDDVVHAIDWKFGRLQVDIVKDNLQAKCYSLGLMQKYNKPVTFSFAQPRINFFDTYTFELSEEKELLKEIKDIISKCKSDTIILNPGIDQCRYCKAKSICPAVLNQFKNNSLTKIEHTTELTADQLSENMKIWQLIKNIGFNLEHATKIKLIKGEAVSGFELESRRGGRKVNDIIEFHDKVKSHINTEDFILSCNPSIPKLEKLYSQQFKKNTGGTLKAGKEEFERITENTIIRNADTLSIKQIK